jgi:hypothetical protein
MYKAWAHIINEEPCARDDLDALDWFPLAGAIVDKEDVQ